jgi:hypothetical protein
VIHHSATPNGGADSFGREHQKKWPNGLGYHFVIGNGTDTNDGQVEVGPRWKRQGDGIDGAHAGNEEYNKYGIGVCIVGDFNSARPEPGASSRRSARCAARSCSATGSRRATSGRTATCARATPTAPASTSSSRASSLALASRHDRAASPGLMTRARALPETLSDA